MKRLFFEKEVSIKNLKNNNFCNIWSVRIKKVASNCVIINLKLLKYKKLWNRKRFSVGKIKITKIAVKKFLLCWFFFAIN